MVCQSDNTRIVTDDQLRGYIIRSLQVFDQTADSGLVEMRGRFVQDQETWLPQQRSSYGYSLSLPT